MSFSVSWPQRICEEHKHRQWTWHDFERHGRCAAVQAQRRELYSFIVNAGSAGCEKVKAMEPAFSQPYGAQRYLQTACINTVSNTDTVIINMNKHEQVQRDAM